MSTAYLGITALLVFNIYLPVWAASEPPSNLLIEAVHTWIVLFLAPLLMLSAVCAKLRRLQGGLLLARRRASARR